MEKYVPYIFKDGRPEDNIGKYCTKAQKTGEPKPFKSGRKVNTIKDIINHPILNIPAYTFEEDDSYVECRRCTVLVKACVKCGFCCTKAPCPFGEWNQESKRCSFLTSNNECSKYEEILRYPGSESAPAFGAGCCMSLCNILRERKLRDESDC